MTGTVPRGGAGPALVVREATADDWPRMSGFVTAVLDEGETYSWDAGADESTVRDFWTGPANERVSVACVPGGGTGGERIVGTAKMGPNRPGSGSHVATASFIVDPGAQARGVGAALGEDMITWAERSGYDSIQFNAVVETNHRAVALWQRLGFEIIGTVPRAFRSPAYGLVGLHVMWRRCALRG